MIDLAAKRIDLLAQIAFAACQGNKHDRNLQIGTGTRRIARKHPEPAAIGVNLVSQGYFHREIADVRIGEERIDESGHPRLPQGVFLEGAHRACLRPFFSHFLDERHAHAVPNLGGAAIHDAVLMEIDLVSVGSLDEPKSRVRIETRYCPCRRGFVYLDLTLHLANTVLQLPACTAKRIVEGEEDIGIAFVRSRRGPDIDLTPVG